MGGSLTLFYLLYVLVSMTGIQGLTRHPALIWLFFVELAQSTGLLNGRKRTACNKA